MVKVRGWFGYGRRTNLQALVEAARRYLDGVQPADGIIEIDATADELFAAMDALQELAEGARSGSALLDDGQGVRVRVGPPGLSTVWGAEPSPAGARRVGSIEGVCPDLIDALAFAPDARSLAIGCCGGWSATALVWDLRRGAPSQALVARDEEDTQFASARRWLSFLGEHLITAGRDSVVRCWDPATGHLLRQRSFRARIEASAAAPDGSGIAVQLEGGSSIQLLDEALKPCGEVYTSPAVALAYGRSGHLLVQARRALDVVSPGREIQTYFGTFQDSVLLPDGRVIAVESRDGGSRLVVLSPGERTELDLARPRALGISPGGQHLVALCHDEVVVLEVASQRRVHHLELPSSVWLGAVVAIDDGGIVALAQGRRLVLWHTAAAAPILEPDPELVQLDRRGRRMLIQHRDGDGEKVIAWRAVDDPGVGGLLEGVPRSIELSMDGRILIQHGDPEDEGERWVSYTELDSGASLGKIQLEEGSGTQMSADARILAVYDDGLALYDAGTGAAVATVVEQPLVCLFAVRADAGAVIAEGRLALFRPSDGAILRSWALEEGYALAIAEDGSWILAAGEGLARYDADADEPRWSIPSSWIDHAVIAPGGEQGVVAQGGVLSWLDAADGALLARAVGHPYGIAGLAFRDDGALVSIGDEGSVLCWSARGVGRPPLPDSVALLRGVLGHGAEVLREVEHEARAAEGAPWVASDPPWLRTGHADLPPITAPSSRMPDPGRAPEVRGSLSFWGEPPLSEAARAYAELTGGAGLQRRGGTLSPEGVPSGVEPDRWIVALGALARRAIDGAIHLELPDRFGTLVFEPGKDRPSIQIGVPPGAWMCLGSQPPQRTVHPSVQHRGERTLWLLEPYAPEAGDQRVEHRPVVRIRVVDVRSSTVLSSTLLPFEPELCVSPDGQLCVLRLEEVQRSMIRMGGGGDPLGLFILDAGGRELAQLEPGEGLQRIEDLTWSPDGRLLAFVTQGADGDRLEIWDPLGGAPVWVVDKPNAWTFLEDGRIVLARQGLLIWVSSDTGEVRSSQDWPGDVHGLVPAGDGLAVLDAQGLTLLGRDGGIQRRCPGLEVYGGALSADATTWQEEARRFRIADGAPLMDHTLIEACALSGEGLATWGDGELIVRRWTTGDVLFRGPLEPDPRWRARAQLGLIFVGDQLVVCAAASIQVLDVRTGGWRHSAPCELASIADVGGGQIVAGQRRGDLRWWDVASGTQLRHLELPLPLRGLSVDTGGHHALVHSGDQAVLFALADGQQRCAVPLDPTDGRCSLAPDGQRFVVTAGGTRLYAASGALLWSDDSGRWAGFVDGGRLLLSAGHGAGIQVVDAGRGQLVGALQGPTRSILCHAEDGEALITAGAGATVWSRVGLSALGWTHPAPSPLPDPGPGPCSTYEEIME